MPAPAASVATLISVRNTIVTAFETAGIQLLGAERVNILSKAANLTDSTLGKVVNALASNVQPHGLASLAGGTIRSALVNSEPSLSQIANADEQAAFDSFVSYLQHLRDAGQGSAAPEAIPPGP